jgi:hypothetical protein
LSPWLYIVFDRAADAEQAQSPGQKSLGVAALAMMYLPAVLVTAVGGLASLLVRMPVLAFHPLRHPS